MKKPVPPKDDAELSAVRDAWPALTVDQRRYLHRMATGMVVVNVRAAERAAEPLPEPTPRKPVAEPIVVPAEVGIMPIVLD